MIKVKRGDWVSNLRRPHDLHPVLAVGKTYMELLVEGSQREKRLLTDIAAHVIGEAGPMLPEPLAWDLDTPPRPTLDPAPPKPEEPPVIVPILVVSRDSDVELVQFWREGRPTVRYRAGKLVLVDKAGQPHREYLVDSRDADTFLNGVDSAYRPDQQPTTSGGSTR